MSFDPAAFLDQTTTEANDIVITPCPEGEYMAIVEKVDCQSWQSRDGTKSGLKLKIMWNVDDADVKATLGRDKILVPQDIMLDLTEAGGLDMGHGKNVNLGKVRAALNLNAPGQPFAPTMMTGRVSKISVKHRVYEDNLYAEVKAVLPLS